MPIRLYYETLEKCLLWTYDLWQVSASKYPSFKSYVGPNSWYMTSFYVVYAPFFCS
jgi:hypothetical protein